MKEDITCNVIVDLLPLYKEGACSDESRDIIERHMQTCEDCRRLCENTIVPPAETDHVPDEMTAFKKVNRKLKKSRLTKAVSVILCVMLVCFGIWNVSWFFVSYRPYHELCKGMKSNDIGKGTQYLSADEEFSYTVKMPGYLSFSGGFINVCSTDSRNFFADSDDTADESSPAVDLFIWLGHGGGTEYGVIIGYGSTDYLINIDSSAQLIPGEDEDTAMYEKMLTDNRDEIERLMNAAQDKWGSVNS